ncbi:hypothetical protein PENSPDRAFT_709120 [Peniophora sp. CONT]|nr:hypothetical protein PENSPDRAFT_709120 [Peniophora sp. CONT]
MKGYLPIVSVDTRIVPNITKGRGIPPTRGQQTNERRGMQAASHMALISVENRAEPCLLSCLTYTIGLYGGTKLLWSSSAEFELQAASILDDGPMRVHDARHGRDVKQQTACLCRDILPMAQVQKKPCHQCPESRHLCPLNLRLQHLNTQAQREAAGFNLCRIIVANGSGGEAVRLYMSGREDPLVGYTVMADDSDS